MLTQAPQQRERFYVIKRGFAQGIAVGTIIPLALTLASTAFAFGFNSPAECSNPTATIDGNQNSLTYTAPAGATIDGVCIKSGVNMFDGWHSGVLGNGTYENGCYSVSGVGTNTVTVERTGSPFSACQGLSHIDVLDSNPGSTPAPSSAPSSAPTPVPSASPASSPVTLAQSSPTPTPVSAPLSSSSPTPVPSASSNPIPSPTPDPSGNTSSASTGNSSSNNGAVAGASGAVLGASAELPATGTQTAWIIAAIASLLSGTSLITIGFRKGF